MVEDEEIVSQLLRGVDCLVFFKILGQLKDTLQGGVRRSDTSVYCSAKLLNDSHPLTPSPTVGSIFLRD